MIGKLIIYLGQPMLLACDARCDKAWGINSRPKKMLSENPDDYVYFSDDELGTAPKDPGTYAGGYGKPVPGSFAYEGEHGKPVPALKGAMTEDMNKWCARECERSSMTPVAVKLPDFVNPKPNIPRKEGF